MSLVFYLNKNNKKSDMGYIAVKGDSRIFAVHSEELRRIQA
ncbi:hypothetical protein FM107_06985 [Sphingobacterium sp. JB170]|nr:hypothetical protein FM107_06985 [Sphingobacterium sp. JB170]